MREVNDQYPEYAEPYEPVKGGKHHKGLYGTRGLKSSNNSRRLVFALAGLLLILLVAGRPGAVEPGPEPKASAKETVVPQETKTEEPTEPESPEPPINPEEHNELPEEPEEPKPPKDPDTPDPPDIPDIPDPPDDPDPPDNPDPPPKPPYIPDEPTPQDPTVSISHVYYWYCLGQIEVEYVVTANDGEDLSSSSTITSVIYPDQTIDMPSKTGAGTMDVNANGTDKIIYESGITWKTEVTLDYTLDGESKTITVNSTGEPELKGLLTLKPQALTGSGPLANKLVSDTIEFHYPADDRHTYDISITRIEMGWMKETIPGGTEYEKIDGAETVWDGTGTSPVSGPAGPSAGGGDKILTFTYQDVLNVTPPSYAAGATHFYMIYYMEGTGTDTDAEEYGVLWPYMAESTPCALFKAPTLTIDHIYDWECIHHVEVEYTIDAGDAVILSSSGIISSVADSHHYIELPAQTGAGTIDVNENAIERLPYEDGDSWKTEITLEYILNGETKTLTVAKTGVPEFQGYLQLNAPVPETADVSDGKQISAVLDFVYPADDRHTYNVSLYEIRLGWMKKNSSGEYELVGSSRTVWPGSGTVTGPSGPVQSGDGKILQFTYDAVLDVTPPSDAAGATAFCLMYETYGYGTDTDGTVYGIDWPWYAQTDPIEFDALKEPTVTFDRLYWYQLVDHLQLVYEITANNATDITSQATITYDPAPSVHHEHIMPQATGAGTKTVEDNADGDMELFSGGEWITTIKLSYKLGGESKEKEFVFPGNPEVFSGDMRSEYGSISGTFSDMNVGYELHVYYEDGDPHVYTPEFTRVDIEWFTSELVSIGTSTIWDESSSKQVFWGPYPSGPDSEGFIDLDYSFWYEHLDATPPLSSARYFTLHFYGKMEGSDEFDRQVELYAETDYEDLPGVTPPSGVEPGVTIGDVYWWRELDHLMVQYTIEANDAVDIESHAELTNGYDTCVMETVSGDGDIEVNLLADDYRSMLVSGSVDITIYYTYTLNGAAGSGECYGTRDVEEMVIKLDYGNSSVGESSGTATISYDLHVEQDGNDPHDYELDFQEIRVLWYYGEDDTWPADERVIWDGSSGYPFTGSGSDYNYSAEIDVTPPDPAYKYFGLRFYAVAYGNDSYDNEYGIDLDHTTENFKLSTND